MLNQRLILFCLIFCFSSVVSAQSYYAPMSDQALIYFIMEDESLNALLCLDVNEAEVEMISKSIKGFSTDYDLTKCYLLSEKGLSLETLDSKLPKLKDSIIKTYTTFNAMAGGAAEDTSTKESTDILFSKLTETQKKVVENMNSEDIFSEFIQIAKSSSVEKVDSEIINVEIENFIYYLNL